MSLEFIHSSKNKHLLCAGHALDAEGTAVNKLKEKKFF